MEASSAHRARRAHYSAAWPREGRCLHEAARLRCAIASVSGRLEASVPPPQSLGRLTLGGRAGSGLGSALGSAEGRRNLLRREDFRRGGAAARGSATRGGSVCACVAARAHIRWRVCRTCPASCGTARPNPSPLRVQMGPLLFVCPEPGITPPSDGARRIFASDTRRGRRPRTGTRRGRRYGTASARGVWRGAWRGVWRGFWRGV